MERKKYVAALIAKGVSQRKIAAEFDISTTVIKIKINKSEIDNAWENNCCDERKRKMRKIGNDRINNKVMDKIWVVGSFQGNNFEAFRTCKFSYNSK